MSSPDESRADQQAPQSRSPQKAVFAFSQTNGQEHYDLPSFSAAELKQQDYYCSTPKKQQAKNALETKKEHGNHHDDDSSFLEFWEQVKLAQQRRLHSSQTGISNESSKFITGISPLRSSRTLSILPEYARYQDHKMQRVLSRGNSLKDITVTPRPSQQQLSPPRVEWVADRVKSSSSGSSSPRNMKHRRSWDEDTLIARHSFPTSIFCKRYDADHPGGPGRNSTSISDLSDGSFHGSIRPERHECSQNDCGSVPSAATLSGESTSTCSEEPMGVRQFLAFLERNPSFSNRTFRQRRTESMANNNPSMVEIAPGVSEPLRRAAETVNAVKNDFYVPLSCFSCCLDIFCIADAKYVVCPSCKVVSPIEAGALDGQKLVQHGLGLGFTCESLFQIQSEILSEQR